MTDPVDTTEYGEPMASLSHDPGILQEVLQLHRMLLEVLASSLGPDYGQRVVGMLLAACTP